MEETVKNTIKNRRIAILAADGCNAAEVTALYDALVAAGATVEIVSKRLGALAAADGRAVTVNKTLQTSGGSIMYDAVYIPGGTPSVEFLKMQGEALHFINEAYKHCKTIAATSEGVGLARAALTSWLTLSKPDAGGQALTGPGLLLAENVDNMGGFIQSFIQAVAQHRYFDRMHKEQTPA